MRHETAAEVVRVVDACLEEFLRRIESMEAVSGSPDALALWRRHAAAVVGAMGTYLVALAWREHRDLMPETPPHPTERFCIASGVAEEAAAAAKKAGEKVQEILTLEDEDERVRRGVAEVQKRIEELVDYLENANEGLTEMPG